MTLPARTKLEEGARECHGTNRREYTPLSVRQRTDREWQPTHDPVIPAPTLDSIGASTMSAFRPRLFFYVIEMTSMASADAVRSALMELDNRATIRIDLPVRRVEIDPAGSEPSAFRDAISGAGFNSIRQWPSNRTHL